MPNTASSSLASSLFLFSILPALAKFSFQNTPFQSQLTQIQIICPSIGNTRLFISEQNPLTYQSTLAKKHHHVPATIPSPKRKLTLLFPSPAALQKIIAHQPAPIIPWGSLQTIPTLLTILKNSQPFKQFITSSSPPPSQAQLNLKTQLLLEIAATSIAPYLEFSNDPLLPPLQIPDGTTHISILETNIHITLHTHHRTLTLSTSTNLSLPHPSHKKNIPTAHIQFQSIHTAHAILTDNLSPSSALLQKHITLSGYIPLADSLQTIMQRAHAPLKSL